MERENLIMLKELGKNIVITLTFNILCVVAIMDYTVVLFEVYISDLIYISFKSKHVGNEKNTGST